MASRLLKTRLDSKPAERGRLAWKSALVLFVVASGGCSGGSQAYQTAPVSGTITLDGQALAGARVTFLPAPELRSSSESGPESMGDTDAQGRYTLRTVFGDTGASLGKNRVMISTRKIELDPTNPDKSKETAKERVPGKYFTDQAPLTFDVPKGGSQEADFSLTTK